MEKGFLIKNSDINDLMWAYKENLSELLKSFAVLRTSIQMLVGDGNFAGKGANSVKKYYLDVHGTAIELFETLAQWMLDTVLPYKVGYNMIDKKEGFILPEESMRKFKDLLQSCLSDTEDSAQIADTAIQSVSDILGLTPPSLDQIEEAHSTIDQNVESKMTEIEEYEKTTACGITKLESFLDTIRSCVAEIESGQFQIIGYSAGAFLSRPEVVQGLGVIKKRREFQRDNKELLDQIWADEAELKRLSDERKEEGVWKTIGGVTLVVVGIVCIAASAGAATPVFIVAAAAGSGTVAFGVADSFEGAQEIYYGSVKDIETKSVNILRDSLFNGNQEAYNIVESIFAYTAAAMTPMGTMSSARTLTLRSGATTVGKLFISDAAGYATSHYVYELTGNRTLSMISGMGGSFAAGFGLNRIDARFSISNGHAASADSIQVKPPKSGFGEQMSPEDAARYNQFWDDVENGIDVQNRIKLNSWNRRPSAKLYVENKHTYDNPKYFNQDTGEVIYPGELGDPNIDGFVNGVYSRERLQKGDVIGRYGDESGRYFSPRGTSFEERALPPFMKEAKFTEYKVLRPFQVRKGKIAPWFDQPGGGVQDVSDYTVEQLRDLGCIKPVKRK